MGKPKQGSGFGVTYNQVCHFERSEKSRCSVATPEIPLFVRNDNLKGEGEQNRLITDG